MTFVQDYHTLSKHRSDGYAKGPETLDWDSQPDPFRSYDGADLRLMPLHKQPGALRWQDLWQANKPGQRSLTSLADLSELLQWSLALSAWKQFGNARWSLRVNPSSGNLHPTESWLLLANIDGLADGIYHYRPDCHGLEWRCGFRTPMTSNEPQILMAFSSVLWREGWKYGERAWRYCQHDVGHALAAVNLALAAMGADRSALQPVAIADAELASLLGLDRLEEFPRVHEYEHPDCLVALTVADVDEFIQRAAAGQWQGKANVLDPKPMYQWPVLQQMAAAAEVTTADLPAWLATVEPAVWPAAMPASGALADEPASSLLLQRRSAQQFDPQGMMQQTDFFTLLDHLLLRPQLPPWQLLPLQQGVELVLFVHQVEGLPSGLYLLTRDPANQAGLQASMRDQFEWQKVESAPDHLPLYRLLAAGTRRTAARLNCQQTIGGDSCFTVSMLANCTNIDKQPWRYRQLYWQAGAIGQQLYLEAEAAGLRGTGIGCFFDDPALELLGLPADGGWQVLYGFTVGLPLIDHRITSWRPYQNR
ncbi:SagB/ThcOx family dehydrogenase [Oceanobacter mangrovi]|uniref:SagB/ThcOx family dehydrogenase n=1 Tax=Oceanobacter mangrovi TaxID=2862510 RepID=UPI001C8E21B6|nr:SagB/ThcOx family dehydrogenase [Oceanobacter mangrovi]